MGSNNRPYFVAGVTGAVVSVWAAGAPETGGVAVDPVPVTGVPEAGAVVVVVSPQPIKAAGAANSAIPRTKRGQIACVMVCP